MEYGKNVCGIMRQRIATLLPTRSAFRRTVSAALALVMVVGMLPTTALAASSLTIDLEQTEEALVKALLGKGIQAENISGSGTLSYVSNAMDELGIDSGIMLDTNGGKSSSQDPELSKLIVDEGKSYGGHTSTLEFDLTATGTLLNFNYVFASREFDQPAKYNDIFGLFVKVNDGDWENIAKLDNGRHITITNLRAGKDGTQLGGGGPIGSVDGTVYDYFTAKTIYGLNRDSYYCNGVSNVFTAQKEVNVGDSVTVKFAIADVGDTSYNSYVIIEAGSLSFAPHSALDYVKEALQDLKPGATYAITNLEDYTKYTIVAGADGTIPLIGLDKDGTAYDFIGKNISIVQKAGNPDGEDSEAQVVVVEPRPEAPEAPTVPTDALYANPAAVIEPDVTTTKNSVIIKAKPGQEYKVDEGEWLTPDSNGYITVSGFTAGKTVSVYTRYAATDSALASVSSSGSSVTLEDPVPLTVTPYIGLQDEENHSPTFEPGVDGVVITYTVSPDTAYSEASPSFKEAGKYTVYYRACKDGYKPVYGQTEVKLGLKVTYDSVGSTSGSAPTDNTYYYPGDEVILRPAGTMIRSGYVFDKWNTASDGSGTAYSEGATFAISNHITLYPTWKEIEKIPVEGNVTFQYSYSYTTENGKIQSGVQNIAERASVAKVTLYKNDIPVEVDPIYVSTVMGDTEATQTYIFADLPKTDEYRNENVYSIQAVAVDGEGNIIPDYSAQYSYNRRDVVMNYTPGCFDAAWRVTLTDVDMTYPVPDSIYVKVLYATEPGAELEDYHVITQQENNNGTQCFKMVQGGNTITYSGSYPVWRYQANKLNQSYYHKFQVVGYRLNGSYVDVSGENYIYPGEMFYTGSAANEVMALSYSKTLIPTVEVAGDISMNYSYHYTTENGDIQRGTQNVGERSTKVKVELLRNGGVADTQIVNLLAYGAVANGDYSFGRVEKYGPSGLNNYTIRVSALNGANQKIADYGVDISGLDATLTYSPECFDAAWTVTLQPGLEVIPSSVNVKVLYALTSDASLDGYEIISQQAENLGVECLAVDDGNGGITYSGSYPVWKYQAGTGGSYYHKIQVVGYTVDGVYYDVSYRNDLISDGVMYFKGSGASETMTLTIAPEIPAEEITVTGTVLESDGITGASNAKVELRKGSETIVSTMTDIYGHYTFVDILDGVYTIVITKEDVTVTKLVTVGSGDVSVDDIIMPSEQRNSVLDNSQAGDYAPDVGGLDEIAANVPLNGASSVEIKLTVTAKTAETAPEEDVSEIKKVASGKKLELIDLTLTQQRNNEPDPTDIGGSNTRLLKIVIPFVKGNKQNITVYRYHGSEVHTLTATPNSDGEYIELGNSSITIHAMKFSTYAIGYTVPSSSGGGGGSYSPSYSITSPDTENGKVTISPKNASKGSTVTITATPDEGYQLAKLAVTDKDGKEIEVIANSDGKYTFKMPAGNVTVTAKFVLATNYSVCLKDETCPICDYTDASAAAWYHDGVHYCIDHSIMTGYGNGVFAPNGIVTRQQVWLTLARISGETPANVAEAKAWAIENGVSDGTNSTMAVSRQQFITMLYRYAVNMGYDVSVGEETNILSYNDAFDIAEYAISAMQWGCGSGVMGGYADGSLNPAATTTRAHLATFLQRFCESVAK